MKSREQYKQELDALSERLKARGVVDVKFTVLDRNVKFEEVADDVLFMMNGILDGTIETTVLTGIGDSDRVQTSQQALSG